MSAVSSLHSGLRHGRTTAAPPPQVANLNGGMVADWQLSNRSRRRTGFMPRAAAAGCRLCFVAISTV
jgi:hypothetical protein